MTMRSRLACMAAVLVAGCAPLQAPQRAHLAADDPALRGCAAWYRDLDAAVERAGVGDAQATRVPGYPYLRLDRFTASFAGQALRDAHVFDAWLARARTLEREARRVELANLPRGALQENDAAALARSESCAGTLSARDLADAPARSTLLARAEVPDAYVGWQRVVGLYPLTAIPFAQGVDLWQAETVDAFRQTHRGAPPAAPLRRFAPAEGPVLSHAEAGEILSRAPRDALGVPQLSAREIDRLFATYAPLFEIESAGGYDQPGALHWGREPVPQVDAARPTVYRRLAFTRFADDVLVQLVYTIWFSERPGDDILAGKLDGLVWRVTLAREGMPLVYDSMHPCGCFHMFFPTARVAPLPAPEPGIEWAFAPRPAPEAGPGERMVLRVATRTHYLKGLSAEPREGGAPATPLVYAEEDALRTLPLPDGGTKSIYRPGDGIVAGSERLERDLFWPMGIPSAGAMRQWGRHATAFVGRRHFDEAFLIDRRFRTLKTARPLDSGQGSAIGSR
ncbi:MAG: hypothetical protein R3357_13410 [Burkholderiales bacterium]|nr:hypothetical protein [Burkholderiales bacterium]